MPDTNPARAAMEPPRKQMVHGVLLVDGAYVLQLRDDVPGIASPGMWAFFGGALEEGEEPELGLRREIAEELSIEIDRCELLCHVDRRSDFWRQVVRYWFFVADVTAQWPSHEVREGQGAGLFRFPELPATGMNELVREVVTRHHRGLAPVSVPDLTRPSREARSTGAARAAGSSRRRTPARSRKGARTAARDPRS